MAEKRGVSEPVSKPKAGKTIIELETDCTANDAEANDLFRRWGGNGDLRFR